MTNKELATEFVKKYPLMFNEDQDFWSGEIEKLLNKVEQKKIDLLCDGLYKKYKYNEWKRIRSV